MVIADTAGRLLTKVNLMEELSTGSLSIRDAEGWVARIESLRVPHRGSPFLYEGFTFSSSEEASVSGLRTFQRRRGELALSSPLAVQVEETWSTAISECH